MSDLKPMKAVDLLKMLLELDSCWLDPRPSPYGQAVVLVQILCEHAEPSVRSDLCDGWLDVDVSQIYRRIS